MIAVNTKKIVNASAEECYQVVKDFEAYPEFLPWCAAARTLNHNVHPETGQEIFLAELAIKYKFFQDTFTTEITCDPVHYRIDIKNVKGPFKKLNSNWNFKPLDQNPGNEKTEIHFSIDFEFRISLFQKMISMFFEEAMRRMTDAFEKRILIKNPKKSSI